MSRNNGVIGVAFYSPESESILPVAVWAEVLDHQLLDGRLLVKPRVRGRLNVGTIVQQAPYVVAEVAPLEDIPVRFEAHDVNNMIDEVMRLHDVCTEVEADVMERFDQSMARAVVRSRTRLSDSVDNKLAAFAVDPSIDTQKFAQLVSFFALDYHFTQAERLEAARMNSSFDRLRYIRDKLREKKKQLTLVKSTPTEKLEEFVDSMRGQAEAREMAMGRLSQGNAFGGPVTTS